MIGGDLRSLVRLRYYVLGFEFLSARERVCLNVAAFRHCATFTVVVSAGTLHVGYLVVSYLGVG